MAFVRTVLTTSGATAVQIFEYVPGGQRLREHLGSAHTEVELAVLLARARDLLADEAQGELDLGLEPVLPAVRLLRAARTDVLLDDLAAGPAPAGPVGSGRTRQSSSRVLFDALVGVYSDLGFDAVGDEVFRDLVVARVVEPTSLCDVGRVLADLGQVPAHRSTMKRTLKLCTDGDYRSQVSRISFDNAVTSGDVTLCLFDVTTLRTTAAQEDQLRKVGYSKDRSIDPQVVVALLVDRLGSPLEIACFEGSKAEKHTIIPVVEAFAEHNQLDSFVVVADAGMMSKANLTALEDAGFKFIVGARQTKAPIDLESHFRWYGDAFTDGQVIDTLTPKTGKNADNDTAKRAEPVWDPTEHPGSWRAVWAYSFARAKRDLKVLADQEARARAVVAGTKQAHRTRFVTVKGSARTLDDRSLARARRLAGLKGYVTDLPADQMPAAEVIASYHELWRIEQSFRLTKTSLKARPLFSRLKDNIEAHLTIVFTALAVTREAQRRTGLGIDRLVKTLKPLRTSTIVIGDHTQDFPPEIADETQDILNRLHRNTH